MLTESVGRAFMKKCVCGVAVAELALPKHLHRLSGRTSILVHVETNNSRCYPDSVSGSKRAVTARLDDVIEGEQC